jgi:methyl-accepting chemotaxis protein
MRTIALASPEFYRSTYGKRNSFWEMRSILQKRTTIFFAVLFLLASLLSGLAIYNHSRDGMAASHEPTVTEQVSDGGQIIADTALFSRHADLEASISILALSIFAVLVLFMLFIRIKVIKPLHRLEKISRKMADGNFDMLVDNHKTSSYVDTIGENVNALAMNLQEILLLIWNHSEHNIATLDTTIDMLAKSSGDSSKEIKTNLQNIKRELVQMQQLTNQFELFDVTFKNKKALAKDNTVNP